MRLNSVLCAVLLLTTQASALNGSLSLSSGAVNAYEIVELTFDHNASYANPWEDLELTGLFVSPTGDTMRVGGFHHSSDTWKVRFAPTSPGTWHWTFTADHDGDRFTESGQLTCTAGSSPGFLKVHTYNPNRLAYADNAPFYPVGLEDCLSTDGPSYFDSQRQGREAYLTAFEDAGFNVFRVSIGNCAYVVEADNGIQPGGNRYHASNSRALDELLAALKSHHFRIILCLFNNNNTTAYADSTANPGLMAAVKRYVKYYVDRWGAYVDIWETVNECYASFGQYSFRGWDRLDSIMVPYMRSVDPYGHLFGREFYHLQNFASLSRYDVAMPHVYLDGTNYNQDSVLLNQVEGSYNTHSGIAYCRSLMPYPMPMLFGEFGNMTTCCWHENSALWHRIRHWVGFLNSTGFVSWHQGGGKTYCGPPSNIWLGPEERQAIRGLQTFCADIDPMAMPDTLQTSDSDIHVHAQSSQNVVALYLYNTGSHASPISGVTVSVDPSFSEGSGYWYEPLSGDTLGTFTTTSGTQTITAPSFTIDLAAKIHTTTPVASVPAALASVRRTKPQAQRRTVDILGRTIMDSRTAVPGVYIVPRVGAIAQLR